jgi:hypothetical protein
MRYTKKYASNDDCGYVSKYGQSGQTGITGKPNTKVIKTSIFAGCTRRTMVLDVEAATSGSFVCLYSSIERRRYVLTSGNNLQ